MYDPDLEVWRVICASCGIDYPLKGREAWLTQVRIHKAWHRRHDPDHEGAVT